MFVKRKKKGEERVVGRADAEPEKGKTNHEDEPGGFALRSLQTWDAFTFGTAVWCALDRWSGSGSDTGRAN